MRSKRVSFSALPAFDVAGDWADLSAVPQAGSSWAHSGLVATANGELVGFHAGQLAAKTRDPGADQNGSKPRGVGQAEAMGKQAEGERPGTAIRVGRPRAAELHREWRGSLPRIGTRHSDRGLVAPNTGEGEAVYCADVAVGSEPSRV